MTQEDVFLKCYDISRGVAKTISSTLLGVYVEAVWHTAILCHGLEWFYGGGIQYAPPDVIEREYDMTPVRVIRLGSTNKPLSAIHTWCQEHAEEFSEDQYNFLHHNCNSFTDSLARFLHEGTQCPAGEEGIPVEILRQHEMIAAQPGGKIIIAMIEAFQRQAKSSQANEGISGFIASGRVGALPGAGSEPEPLWSPYPDEFEGLVRQIWEDQSLNVDLKKEALRRLYLLAYNVTRNATDMRYRSVNAANEVVRGTILAIPQGHAALEALGFKSNAARQYSLGDRVDKDILSHLNRAVKLLQSVSAAGSFQLPASVAPKAKTYEVQLQRLQELGFTNVEKNVQALTQANGNINQAIDRLLE